jgi:hypothetical protein
VSLSTNTANELFRRAEEDLMTELRSTLPPNLVGKIRGYQQVHDLLYLAVAMTRGVNANDRRLQGDPYNYRLFDIAD